LLKLFEEYVNDIKTGSSETTHTWSEIRDAIQMKRPFVIIVFRTKQGYLDYLESSFKPQDYIKQSAFMDLDGKRVRYPSVFYTLEEDRDTESDVRKLYEKFPIKAIIIGESNRDSATLYSQDGSSSEFGNEIISTIEERDFVTEDYFKIGSTFYRFIEFND